VIRWKTFHYAAPGSLTIRPRAGETRW
jgi:hypothetical protein